MEESSRVDIDASSDHFHPISRRINPPDPDKGHRSNRDLTRMLSELPRLKDNMWSNRVGPSDSSASLDRHSIPIDTEQQKAPN